MFKLLTRQQFAEHFENMGPGLGEDDSVLWTPEWDGKQANWFVSIKPVTFEDSNFWTWIEYHCRGLVRCYSSGNEEEWWGFTHRNDVELWLLKWGA